MDEKIEITDKDGATELKNVKGDIEFRNVGFSYTDDGKKVPTKRSGARGGRDGLL